jgi:hypothetical protein
MITKGGLETIPGICDAVRERRHARERCRACAVYTPLHQDTLKEVMEANGKRKYVGDIVTFKRASKAYET